MMGCPWEITWGREKEADLGKRRSGFKAVPNAVGSGARIPFRVDPSWDKGPGLYPPSANGPRMWATQKKRMA